MHWPLAFRDNPAGIVDLSPMYTADSPEIPPRSLRVCLPRHQETAQKYEVFQMPTFLFMKKGEVVEQFSGANIAVLRQRIDRLS